MKSAVHHRKPPLGFCGPKAANNSCRNLPEIWACWCFQGLDIISITVFWLQLLYENTVSVLVEDFTLLYLMC